MEQLFQKGVRIFSFIDDGLITRNRSERRWAEELAQALERSGLADEIIWSIFCRVDEVDADILGRLKDCGLDRLRSAMKDVVVIDKFFPGRYDARAYGESITSLTKTFNDSAFETLYKAVQSMEDRSEEDILYYWYMLDMLCRQEFGDSIRSCAGPGAIVPCRNSGLTVSEVIFKLNS
jgi:hypothetical protein